MPISGILSTGEIASVIQKYGELIARVTTEISDVASTVSDLAF